MLGPQCSSNPPALSSTSGEGHLEDIAGIKTYVTGDPNSDLALLLAADAYGYEAPKLRKLADKLAASGFFIVVPDFFYGDPYSPEKPGFDRQAWFNLHHPDKGCEEAKAAVDALKSKGFSKVGAAGFCWGGMVVVRLAKYDCIQAGVILHPGPLTEEEIKAVKVPIAILGAESDNSSPPEHLKHLGEILSAKAEVDSYVKIFPGVGHGWSVRYDENNESAVKSALESHEDMLNWFTKHLKQEKFLE